MLKCLDTMILLYLVDKTSPHHERAVEIIEQAEAGLWRSCVCFVSLVEFLAIVTSEKRVRHPMTPKDAQNFAEKIMKAPQPEILYSNAQIVRDSLALMEKHRAQRQYLWEALIAATMLAHGVKTIITTQSRGFQAIREIQIENPFEALFA
ncbi:MAG: type II toxin-antitoxin system VapC family toxin [Calditrichaeota bacterium]|nr:type II toxin-antitoxin system VapC family toxin [Calditrichota bacterium]